MIHRNTGDVIGLMSPEPSGRDKQSEKTMTERFRHQPSLLAEYFRLTRFSRMVHLHMRFCRRKILGQIRFEVTSVSSTMARIPPSLRMATICV